LVGWFAFWRINFLETSKKILVPLVAAVSKVPDFLVELKEPRFLTSAQLFGHPP